MGCKISGSGLECKISGSGVGCKISGIGVGEGKTLASYCTSSLWVVLKLTLPLPCCVVHCFLSFMGVVAIVVVNLCKLIKENFKKVFFISLS